MVVPDGDASPTPQAFFAAIEAGKRRPVENMLQQCPALINAKNEQGETALHLVAKSGRVRLLLDLMNKGAKVSLVDYRGNTPAHTAAMHGQEGMVIWLWKKGADLEHVLNAEQMNVLSYVSSRVRKVMCNTEAALLPIPTMASNMKAARGDVARFAEAAEEGKIEVLKEMLAIHEHNYQATQELLESRGLNGKNPLHIAVENHHVDIVKLLLKHGSDPDAEEEYMNTPLIIAANYSADRPEIVNALIDAGANVNCVSMFGLVPLLIAAENGFVQVVQSLVERAECDINIRGSFQNTALHLAVLNKHYGTIRYLYKAGADTQLENDEKKTPLQLATPHILYLLTDGKEGVFDQSEEEGIRSVSSGKEADIKHSHGAEDGADSKASVSSKSMWQREYYEKSLLSGKNELRIDAAELSIGELVGGGTFGRVHHGWYQPQKKEELSSTAVQAVTLSPASQEKKDLEEEASTAASVERVPKSEPSAQKEGNASSSTLLILSAPSKDSEGTDTLLATTQSNANRFVSRLRAGKPSLRSLPRTARPDVEVESSASGEKINVTNHPSAKISAEDVQTKGKSSPVSVSQEDWEGSKGEKPALNKKKGRREVAVKLLRGNLDGQRRYLEMLRQEILIMSDLQHEHILQLIGASCIELQGQRHVVVVTAWAALGSASRLVREKTRQGTVLLDSLWLKTLALGTAKGLAYAHEKGILHRDVRADNVLVHAEPHRAVLADWGLASKVRDVEKSKTPAHALGSLRWMAPEVFAERKVSTAADVYSFGVFLWELLNGGAIPFRDRAPLEVAKLAVHGVRPVVPEVYARQGWSILLQSCWRAKPEERPTAAQLVKSLMSLFSSYQKK